ncbi:hypothetical protein [Aeromicrobium sp. UC242_57]|uniref:hypothetical protein n=1 Tax=Aeromicrobium sp. UC242_57 TaxID=3374624 RepID=UPI003793D09A
MPDQMPASRAPLAVVMREPLVWKTRRSPESSSMVLMYLPVKVSGVSLESC